MSYSKHFFIVTLHLCKEDHATYAATPYQRCNNPKDARHFDKLRLIIVLSGRGKSREIKGSCINFGYAHAQADWGSVVVPASMVALSLC
jgi:hypothetical protein